MTQETPITHKFLAGLLIAALMPVPPAVAAPEATITGEVHLMIGDDFASGKTRIVHHIRDESTGKFLRIKFLAKTQREFNPGERIELRGYRLLPGNQVELVDNSPAHIRRFEAADNDLTFPPAQPVEEVETAAAGSEPSVLSAAPFPNLPILHSNPSATAKLFLDFDGHFESTWGGRSNVTTPPYDQDGDRTTLTQGEIDSIVSIWRRVSEAYSPFNINVTTEDPGNQADKKTAVVAIGGSYSDWYGSGAGGVAYVGGFYNSAPNVGYVFEDNLANGNAKYTAAAASHEAGHLFGLQHQATWSGSTLTESYSSGDGFWAPHMGVSYYCTKPIWHNGTTSAGPTTYQDDLAILSGASNAFGYKADESGETAGSAQTLALVNNTASATGVIGRTTDGDWYKLTLPAGSLAVSVSVPAPIPGEDPMLDSTVKLFDGSGNLLQSAGTARTLSESLQRTVAAGTYYIGVYSNGTYGDVGQYQVSAQITPSGGGDTTAPTVAITAPAGGATVSGTAGVSVAASDDTGVTRVELYKNGTLLASDAAAPYDFLWDTAAGANGAYTLTASAFDAAGNSSSYAVTVTVNNADVTAPSVQLTTPADGATVSGTIGIAASAADNIGVSRVEFYKDGALLASDTSSPYSTTWNTSTEANGAHTILAKAYDAAGNSASGSIVVNVGNVPDATAPTSAITSPGNGSTIRLRATNVAISGSDNVGVRRVELWVNGVQALAQDLNPAQASYSVALSWTPPALGQYTLQARAIDAAGNIGSSASVGVSVQNKGRGQVKGSVSLIDQSANDAGGVSPSGFSATDAAEPRSLVLTASGGGKALSFDPDVREASIVTLRGQTLAHVTRDGGPIMLALEGSLDPRRLESGLLLVVTQHDGGKPQAVPMVVVR